MLALLTACTEPEEPGLSRAGAPRAAESGVAAGDSTLPGDIGDSAPGLPPGPYNVIVIMTDDEWVYDDPTFPERDTRLASEATRFTRAYVSNPLCCPSRASFLSGGFYSRDTGVLTNAEPNGGGMMLDHSRTLAVNLQRAGYRTGFFGKYLNSIDVAEEGVPPGWSEFLSVGLSGDWSRYGSVRGASTPDATGPAEQILVTGYVTRFLSSQAVAFMEDSGDTPFFLWLAHHAPHAPATPDADDAGAFAGYTPRGGAFDEADVSDKPAHLQAESHLAADQIAENDAHYQASLESLLAVDRSTGELLDTLHRLGIEDRTVVIYTSDNGYLWGQHRVYGKGLPYEEAVRVPLLVRAPGGSAQEVDVPVLTTIDLGATVYAALGMVPPGEGVDLVSVAQGMTVAPSRDLYVESFESDANGVNAPPWSGILRAPWKYIAYATGETELYRLDTDPSEENNVSGQVDLALTAALASRLAPERALAVATPGNFVATPGVPFEFLLEAVGGTPPLSWSTGEGGLPEGVALDASGRLTGSGAWSSAFAQVTVTDSSVSPYDGTPQAYAVRLEFDRADAARPRVQRVVRQDGRALAWMEAPTGTDVELVADTSRDLDQWPRRWRGRLAAGEIRAVDLGPLSPAACLYLRLRAPGHAAFTEDCPTTSR